MTYAEFPTFAGVVSCMEHWGVTRIVAKALSENDNTKQQIYLGGNFESLNVIPYSTVVADTKPKTPNLKAMLSLSWIDVNGVPAAAPHTKLILYPDYPEVRLSGFLMGCPNAPTRLLQPVPRDRRRFNNGPDGRVLLFGICGGGQILAYLAAAQSAVALAF